MKINQKSNKKLAIQVFHVFLQIINSNDYIITMIKRFLTSQYHLLVITLLSLFLCTGRQQAMSQNVSHSIDFFSGVDFNFRDINFNTQYEVLIRLTPGFKWNMGNHWQLSGQVHIPIINQFGEDYKYIRPNIFDISKELRLGNLYLKPSIGLFSLESYGIDLIAFLPLCKWFAFEGQVGCVGTMVVNPGWAILPMNHFVGTIGGDFYLSRWNTQFRGVVGKYLFRDFGFEMEAMRHFNKTTVSVYTRWSDIDGLDGGFRIIITLPPYQRKHRTVNFRPASNFRMAYTVMYHNYSNRMYRTDPEENEREGWFSRDFLQWGSHTMEPDFRIKE
jgi:hypothetical protein